MFTGRANQLTIFISEADQYRHQALYAALLETLRREGCGGATAVRGIAGFGGSTVIHTSAILRLSMDLPLVITVIDRPERIDRVIAPVREIAPDALITVQQVQVVQSGAPFREGLPDVKVSEIMRREVVRVHPESPVTEVVQLLLDKDFTAVPVVDDENKLVGMVSDNDLLKRGGIKVTLSLKRATDPDFVQELHSQLKDPGRKVSEVMTRDVVTVPPNIVLGKAAKLMVEKHLKRLPVVDDRRRLIGILGRLDILNTIAAVHLPEWHPEAHPAGTTATVAEVMTRAVPTVHESATLEEIFQLLVSSSHKRVVVVDDQQHVAGVIADSDLISRVSRENWPGVIEILVSKVPIEKIGSSARHHIQKLRGRCAKDLMTPHPITVREEMPVASALALSAERRTKRLPVVDADGHLVGMVGRAEMMRALLV
jgi:CBS domain-containing protein